MQIVVIICIPVLILTILASKEIIPSRLNVLLSGIIIIIGAFIIGAKVIDLSNRDNMNYDEYNWYFDKSEAPTSTSDSSSSSSSDPWATPTVTCVGAECCYDNSTYDSVQNICVPTTVYNANQALSTSTTETTTETTDTTSEAFISGVLSKYVSLANYPQARLQGNINAYNSQSNL